MEDFHPLPGVRRIVVMHPSAVGDFVFALPCLHALRITYPDARISYIGKQWHADFLANRPGPVDDVTVLPPCPGLGLPAEANIDPEPSCCNRGGSDPRRRWPAERFAALGDILAREGAVVAINGSREESDVVARVLESMRHPAINLCGQLSLSGLCGVLERASLVVSNDTGPLHLALAVGTPAVGIYWLTNVLESAPLRQDHHRAAMSLRVHCPVCGVENIKTRCAHDDSFVNGVSIEEASQLALALYHERAGD